MSTLRHLSLFDALFIVRKRECIKTLPEPEKSRVHPFFARRKCIAVVPKVAKVVEFDVEKEKELIPAF